MELKLMNLPPTSGSATLLIVPYGIETAFIINVGGYRTIF